MPKKAHGKTRYLAFMPAALLAFLIIFLMLTPPQMPAQAPTQVGSMGTSAPDFTLEVLDANGLTGRTLSFSSLRGKPVFIEFVFEWCPHCNNMAPSVKKLHQEYGDRVVFLTVLGSQGTTPEKSAEFIQKHGISWTSVYDPDMKTFLDYGVRGTPTYFFISPEGVVVRMLAGEQSYDMLSFAMEELLSF